CARIRLGKELMNYFDAVFWQVAVIAPKKQALLVEDFFLNAGALSTYELLYAEGKTHNLTEENTTLYFFFEEKFPIHAFTPMALATIGLAELPFTIAQVEYADYLKEFEKSFKAFELTQKTALVPPWDENNAVLPPHLKSLYLVPGMAFGTGKHSTTQLMVEFIEETVRPTDTVLDMGTGSGILAIAALLYGAQKAYGFDVETLAVESAAANLELNVQKYNRPFNAHFQKGDFTSLDSILCDKAITVFLANILPNIFEANATSLKAALYNCRAWALSGIPTAQGDAFSAFLKTITPHPFLTREKDEWLVVYHR
ncbi:MAG TPA: 50S ribosomal protein L11 methyltransferase, partial [Turneriella sp.]|nr:50S ribosomal protein L11 methyltransferase [Turneriella sp.]